MSRILIASGNPSKINWIKRLLAGAGLQGVAPHEVGALKLEIAETGSTVEENALLKARAYHEQRGMPTFGDDSGMEIDALDGKPGVAVRRWGGRFPDEMDDATWLAFFLDQVKEVPENKRTGKYVTAWAIVDREGCSFVNRLETPFRYAIRQLRPISPGWPMDAITEQDQEEEKEIEDVHLQEMAAWIRRENILPMLAERR